MVGAWEVFGVEGEFGVCLLLFSMHLLFGAFVVPPCVWKLNLFVFSGLWCLSICSRHLEVVEYSVSI